MDQENDKLLLYLLFELTQKLLYAVNGNLLTGHDVVKKCKKKLIEGHFLVNHGG
jgi:hypothetical protein